MVVVAVVAEVTVAVGVGVAEADGVTPQVVEGKVLVQPGTQDPICDLLQRRGALLGLEVANEFWQHIRQCLELVPSRRHDAAALVHACTKVWPLTVRDAAEAAQLEHRLQPVDELVRPAALTLLLDESPQLHSPYSNHP